MYTLLICLAVVGDNASERFEKAKAEYNAREADAAQEKLRELAKAARTKTKKPNKGLLDREKTKLRDARAGKLMPRIDVANPVVGQFGTLFSSAAFGGPAVTPSSRGAVAGSRAAASAIAKHQSQQAKALTATVVKVLDGNAAVMQFGKPRFILEGRDTTGWTNGSEQAAAGIFEVTGQRQDGTQTLFVLREFKPSPTAAKPRK